MANRQGRGKTGESAGFAARGLAGLALLAIALLFGAPQASAQDRTLSFKQMHTGETLTVTYMRNGRYDSGALKQINHILRDWRRNEATDIDPRLLDVVWEVIQRTGSRAPVHVLSAYRSPVTNENLRSRSRGVAKNSQHTVGKAMDFYLPDVPLSKLREVGLKMQSGGVGFYPSSGSPFVHLDTASVRHWPRLSRQQLVNLFPDGKTLHLPSDGKPLPGYETAKAELARGRTQTASATSSDRPRLAFWRRDDAGTGSRSSGDGSSGRSRGLLAALFSSDEEEESTPAMQAEIRPAPQAAPRRSAEPGDAEPRDAEAAIAVASAPMPRPRPRPEESPSAPEPAEMAIASAPLPTPRPEAPETDLELVTASLPAVLPRERPTAPQQQVARTGPALARDEQRAAMALAPSSTMPDDLPFSATFTDSDARMGERPAFYAVDMRPAATRALSTPVRSDRAPALAVLLHPDQSDLSELTSRAGRVVVNRFEPGGTARGDGFAGTAVRALPVRDYTAARRASPVATALAR